MRFMMMHKHQASVEEGQKPDPKLIQEMGEFVGGYMKSGRLHDGAGLGPSKTRSRLTVRDGKSTVKHGPYAGERELPSEIHLLKVKTREEGLEWAERYGKILGDGEIELGKVTEPWDLGLMAEPANAPLQLLLIEKADRASEKGEARSEEKRAGLAQLKSEMTDKGVLVRSTRLQPSSQGKRLEFVKNKLTVHDGPFLESKELIGGFAVIELSGFDEAIEVCKRYTEILGGTLEVDLRIVA